MNRKNGGSKMKNTITALLIFLMQTAIAGEWERVNLDDFNELQVSGNVRVQLVKSDEVYMEIFDYCCSMSDLNFKLDDSELKLNNDKGHLTDEEFEVILHYSSIEKLKVMVGAFVSSNEKVNAEKFELDVVTGARVELEIETGELDFTANTGSVSNLKGKAESMDLDAFAGSIVEMEEFELGKAEIKANTGSQISLKVNESISASAWTGAMIEYSGNPKVLERRTQLGGVIEHLD